MGSTYFSRKQYFKIYLYIRDSLFRTDNVWPVLPIPAATYSVSKTDSNSTFKMINTLALKSAVPSQGLSKILWATKYCLALLTPHS